MKDDIRIICFTSESINLSIFLQVSVGSAGHYVWDLAGNESVLHTVQAAVQDQTNLLRTLRKSPD